MRLQHLDLRSAGGVKTEQHIDSVFCSVHDNAIARRERCCETAIATRMRRRNQDFAIRFAGITRVQKTGQSQDFVAVLVHQCEVDVGGARIGHLDTPHLTEGLQKAALLPVCVEHVHGPGTAVGWDNEAVTHSV